MSVDAFFAALTLETLERFVAEHQEEHLALEFKTLGSSEIKSGSDKRHLAEALSGFANSAGGVVVWGIATQKNAAGQDAADAFVPVSNPALLVNRLAEFTALYVTPFVPGVRHRYFERPDGTGFAATYVPASDAGPHMALVGLDRYFKRGPLGFYAMQHFDIADMFGRRQRPILRLELSEPHLGSSGNGQSEVRIVVSLINDGRASAVAPFVRVELATPYTVTPVGLASRDQGSVLRLVAEAAHPSAYAFVGTTDFIVHPKMRFQIAAIVGTIRDHDRVPGCSVLYMASALDVAPTEESLLVEPLRVAVALNRIVDGEPRRRY